MIAKILRRLGLVRLKDVIAITERERHLCNIQYNEATTYIERNQHLARRDEIDTIEIKVVDIGEG